MKDDKGNETPESPSALLSGQLDGRPLADARSSDAKAASSGSPSVVRVVGGETYSATTLGDARSTPTVMRRALNPSTLTEARNPPTPATPEPPPSPSGNKVSSEDAK